MNIKEFKQGDIITRVAPDKTTGSMKFMGEKLIFAGILNGMMYFKLAEPITTIFGQIGAKAGIPMSVFTEGWEYWKDPAELFKALSDDVEKEAIEYSLEEQLTNALKEENYELAAQLEKKIKGE